MRMTRIVLIVEVKIILMLKRCVMVYICLVFLHSEAVSGTFGGSGLPWEQPLDAILASIQGPVAKVISVIAIVFLGLSLAFGETSGGFRRALQIVFGLSIAFAASSFFLDFFNFQGASGAVID